MSALAQALQQTNKVFSMPETCWRLLWITLLEVALECCAALQGILYAVCSLQDTMVLAPHERPPESSLH